ncbi:MAG: hypothetical protein KDI55_18075, partial [Anaerolineae bacterium]|nr:hypothetical protein [Anaerolineae bacterium]
MSIVRIRSLIPLLLAILFVATGASMVVAQDITPPPPLNEVNHDAVTPIQDPDGLWIMPGGADQARIQTAAPSTTGGPDDFGYTWDDSVPLNWIDVSGGIETGINSNVDHVGPINIGFPFKYYENTRSHLFISRFGFLSFNDTGIYNSQSRVPSTEKPDDVIAPHWVPNYNDPNGYIRYLRGGMAPNRWLAVEWNRLVSNCCNGDPAEEYTFEAILHENGDIVFQYGAMERNGGYWCQASGIEDSFGLDGLSITPYCSQVAAFHAVRITRPAPSARVGITPLHQGSFVHDQEVASFQITIRNTGELGADTYNLIRDSSWPLTLYHANGVTPLSDTDGDGRVDTGSVSQGGAKTITALVRAPSNISVGDENRAKVTVRSSIDGGKQKEVELRTAVPSTFVQAFEESGSPISLLLARPEARRETTATGTPYYGNNMAVAEQPSGNLVYTWSVGRCLDTNCTTYVNEIQTAILDPYGDIVQPATRLIDLSSASFDTRDYPSIAVAPNGRIGLLWRRYLWDGSTSRYNYNIYFAILNSSGVMFHGPTNLTQNTVWGGSGGQNGPWIDEPRITATTDNRFVLTWRHEYQNSQGYATDIWYSIRQSNGDIVKSPTNLTNDVAGYEDWYAYPTLASVAGARSLLAFSRYRQSNGYDIYFVVLDGDGNVVRSMSNLSTDGSNVSEYRPDAVELSDGRILVAWTGEQWTENAWRYEILFAVLDPSFNRIAGPTSLSNPAALTGNDYISVAADSTGHAILSWMDYDYSSRRNLYYALVRSNGNVLTSPTIFKTSLSPQPNLFSSFEGDGNTSYHWTPPAGVDNQLVLGQAIYSGALNGGALLDIQYRGRGGQTATGVTLTATLDPRLVYHSDTSGTTPTVSGNTVTWALPDVRLFDRREFRLLLRVTDAGLG